MHRRSKTLWLLARSVPRCIKLTSSTQDESTPTLAQLKQAAMAKGFARRDSVEGQTLITDSSKQALTTLEGGVRVANLPASSEPASEFATYTHSTTDFTSYVTAHGETKSVVTTNEGAKGVTADGGSALGAGFGVRPDKRLGFLRPRQSGTPWSATLSGLSPKYDENGEPVVEDETKLTPQELMRRRKQYLKQFEGTTLSQQEHFLLVDLDFDKDSVIFGHTREEFERNVRKLQEVITAYTRWERTDNAYYYATLLLKVLTLCIAAEGLYNYYEVQLFAAHYDTFADAVEAEVASLDAERERDYERVLHELHVHPPDFAPIVAAIAAEKRRVEAAQHEAEEQKRAQKQQEQTQEQRGQKQDEEAMSSTAQQSGMLGKLLSSWWGSQGEATRPSATRVLTVADLVHGPTHHPMDTTHEAQAAARERERDREREMQRLHWHAVREAMQGYSDNCLTAALRRIFAPSISPTRLSRPLQDADFARYSYAASPTSVETMRAIRRILLPRSEDYVQLVREEMLDYQREKERARTASST